MTIMIFFKDQVFGLAENRKAQLVIIDLYKNYDMWVVYNKPVRYVSPYI